jgi:alpha-ketoglutarate-dependent taurine dioxygenase
MLTDDEQQFLLNSIITEPDIIKQDQLKSGYIGQNTNLADSYPIIAKHWLTGKPIIRFTILPDTLMVNLVSHDGQSPNDEQIKYFETLIRKIEQIIATNEDIRMVHRWQQGDLIIPDMFKLAHAVTGGFNSEDREFRGIWAYQK